MGLNPSSKTSLTETFAPDIRNYGRLFVFEGPDDVGKTTLATMLSQHLAEVGRKCQLLSFPGRESRTLSELVYRLYHDPQEFGILEVSPIAMQVVVTAAHVDVIETRIKPLIRTGVDIVLDRFWWSTWVYAKVEHVPDDNRDLMIKLEMQSWADIRPEAVFFVVRREPLLEQPLKHRWVETAELYKELSKSESGYLPVHRVNNEGTPSESFKTVLSRLA